MGFANVSHGLRAMGYVEPDPLPAGPVALVTHSGSVFSTMLRSRRAFGFTLAVSSGQELVTAAPSYLSYALDVPDTKVIGLILEAMRRPDELRNVLARAAERGLPVVLLTAGNSASGRAMVAAHSGALAGSDGGWEALVRYYGIHRVSDLAEMADALELFALRATRRAGHPARANGERPWHRDGARLGSRARSHYRCREAVGVPPSPRSVTRPRPGRGAARSWSDRDEPARRLGTGAGPASSSPDRWPRSRKMNPSTRSRSPWT